MTGCSSWTRYCEDKCLGRAAAPASASRSRRRRATRWNASHRKDSTTSMAGLYDQLTIFGGNSNPELTREVCRYIDIPPGRLEVQKFSNDNIFVRIGESVRANDVFVVQSFST